MSAPTSNSQGTGVFSPTRAQIKQRTLRTDAWWKSPLIIDLGFAAFVIYATVRAFLQNNYYVAEYGYLTPFYSPCVSTGCVPEASHFGQFLPDVWWLPYAAVSLPFLLLFRLTCYYYRGAYYRTVWQAPTACAVAEPHARYTGETRFPLIIQNTHRYFFYIAVIISVINTYDAIIAFAKPGGGFGLGWATSSWWSTSCCCGPTRCPALLPARGRRPAQAFLQTPGAVLDVDPDQQAEHPAQDVRVDHPGHPDVHRLLHHAGRQRHHQRPEIRWLTVYLRKYSEDCEWVTWSGTPTTWS